MKRTADLLLAAAGLLLLSPLLLLIAVAVWLQDGGTPFYMPHRAGRGYRVFRMVKFRTMVIGADKRGGSSTALSDCRITSVGRMLRRVKLDELTQLWNVVVGEMSLVGPRPQVVEDAHRYTNEERHLLDVRPGITDLASIVFADEGEVINGTGNPDLAYNQLIRPWKSRLSLLYVRNHSVMTDALVVALTILGLFSHRAALTGVEGLLKRWGASQDLIDVARRHSILKPYPPPGRDTIVELTELA